MNKYSTGWIRERREELDISQDDLARRMQLEGETVDRSSIGHWETDRRTPRLNNPKFRRALAKALEMDETEILIKSGFPLTSKHSDEAEEAAHIVDRLAPERKELAIKLLKALEA